MYKSAGGIVIVLEGEISVYDADGNLMCGATSLAAALAIIGGS